jgi:hypothetical protein
MMGRPIARPWNPGAGGEFGGFGTRGGLPLQSPGGINPVDPRVMGSFDKLKGKKKIKKSGVYKLKKGESVIGKRKKSDSHAFIAGRKA